MNGYDPDRANVIFTRFGRSPALCVEADLRLLVIGSVSVEDAPRMQRYDP
jgi:hypothetical protein